ncbi:MAG TPA: hypothetical protein VMG12_00240 [Polyangiaceae bacterium]|nr:hypothetical protein [Polyangiaceae bacterium]
MGIGQELLNVPMGDMIRQMAFAIADAQVQLDEASLRVAEMMSGRRIDRDANGNAVGTPVDTTVLFDGEKLSMMELGFTPTFYHFIDTVIEVKIAIKISQEIASSTTIKGEMKTSRLTFGNGGFSYSVTTTPVDATYSSKYNYSLEGSSLLRTKLAPVPPPAILEERIRKLIEPPSGGG